MHRLGNALLSGRCLGGIGRSIKDTNKQIFRYNSSGLPKLQNDDDAVENVETIYRRWLQNPSSVSTGWNAFFQNVSNTKSDMKGSSSLNYIQERGYAGSQVDSKKLTDNLNVIDLIRRYQTRGYLQADLDPLGLNGCVVRMHFVTPSGQPLKHIKDEHKRMVDELRAVIKDDQLFQLPGDTYIGGNETSLPLSEIIKRLEEAYCRHITVEYGHLNSMAQCEWLKKRFEPPGVTKLSKDLKRLTLARVIRSVGFEAFANKKFPSVKRFGVEGGESGIVCLKQILDKSSEFGATCFVMGMAHRGRVNTIANVCRQDLEHVFAQFHSLDVADPFEADVKYHLGLCLDRLNSVTNKQIRCIMIANPSHLECSGSLVMGRTRAEQFFRGDTTGKMVVPILVHGDAALAGQGIVYEIAQFGDVPGFTTFGSIHVVLNNQLGYTTVPVDGRTSEFSTDLAKVVAAPIIRVNGDNPEAVVYAANIAAEWRATWHRDIFIDIVVYRRQGHSEGDEPSFTQPIMYNQIKNTKSIMDLYAEKLISEGVVNAKEIEETKLKYEKLCEAALEKGKTHKTFNPLPWADSKWSPDDFKNKKQEMPITGIPEDVIHHILNAISAVPQGLVLHKGFERIFKGRKDLHARKELDFAMAEACAFGSLLKEGIHVRGSGQDFQRGTFSHRHYIYYHQTKNELYMPLAHLYDGQAVFTPINSTLSEYAVVGFEFGYSQCNPNALCVWEAQFGDFENTAQCIFDCFVCNTRQKWLKESGLVVNLPHGLEGMGADHSSARPERFLAQCNDDPTKFSTTPESAFQQLKDCNWIVCQVTTPANLFHLYRRQVYLPFRRPLISFTPKSLLRVPSTRSTINDIKEGTQFMRVIPDPVDPAGVKKVAFSVGKVYYDLVKARAAKKLDKEIALVRIEQAHPFPYDLLAAEIAKYPNAKYVFVQEEHCNQGYHHFVIPRLQNLLPGKEIKLVSRGPGAGGAPGMPATFARQLVVLLKKFIEA